MVPVTATASVEVVFAVPGQCWRRRVPLEPGMTARQAVTASGLESVWRAHGLDDKQPPLGIFGRKLREDEALSAGDRVEIYRPLTADPRQRRRERVDARRRRD